MRVSVVFLALIISCETGRNPVASSAIEVDGLDSEVEWSNARSGEIKVSDEWTIGVKYMQDNNNFYFFFSNLKLNGQELYPEVLIDIGDSKPPSWNDNLWWFHTSYRNCESNGKHSNYGTCEKGLKIVKKKIQLDWK
ncbi:MAG TPA: hypothetical protein PKN99_12540 [Cyclobacteriaceae bacterium]|nr:hypothetical protein [Cyclobacteriaceae bacterium]